MITFTETELLFRVIVIVAMSFFVGGIFGWVLCLINNPKPKPDFETVEMREVASVYGVDNTIIKIGSDGYTSVYKDGEWQIV